MVRQPIVLAALFLALLFLEACGTSEGQVPGEGGESASAASTSGESAAEAFGQDRLPPPGKAWVIFREDTVVAELARTPQEREMGLMYREALEKNTGMLFIFQDSQVRSFWMKNTFIPLDIAYLDAELRVVDIQGMEAQTLDSHPSAQPAMFALEVPLGWFEEMGIGVGAQAQVIFGPG